MDADWRKRFLLIMIVVLGLVTARTAYLFYERSRPGAPLPTPPTVPLTDDDYVTPHRIVPYDLKSAVKELAGKTVWVRNGNSVPYYRYHPQTRSVEFAPKAGLLPPLDKLQVTDVIPQRAPVSLAPGQVAVVRKQVMAIFEESGRPGLCAVSIGTNMGDDFTFNVNEIFYYEDPHDLYKHWPPDVWHAIDQHQVQKGMNELQVSFALGSMVGASPGDYGNRWAQYRNDGELVTVTFEKNRVVEIVGPSQ
ncbi:MAG TPA: hypothetical protein VI488_11270 [Candidatus Angelobacter sp.]